MKRIRRLINKIPCSGTLSLLRARPEASELAVLALLLRGGGGGGALLLRGGGGGGALLLRGGGGGGGRVFRRAPAKIWVCYKQLVNKLMKITSCTRILAIFHPGLLRVARLLIFRGHLCVVALLATADEDSHGTTNRRALV